MQLKDFSTQHLRDCIKYTPEGKLDRKNPAFLEMVRIHPPGTNVLWVAGAIGEILYERDEIDEDELYRLTD
jgi:hypothetical protein